jgi:hypothetical protein
MPLVDSVRSNNARRVRDLVTVNRWLKRGRRDGTCYISPNGSTRLFVDEVGLFLYRRRGGEWARMAGMSWCNTYYIDWLLAQVEVGALSC